MALPAAAVSLLAAFASLAAALLADVCAAVALPAAAVALLAAFISLAAALLADDATLPTCAVKLVTLLDNNLT